MPRRPFSVTLLALLVLALTILNAIRCGAAFADRRLLAEFAPRPGPWYIALTGLIWALAGLVLYVGLAQGSPWARRAGLALVPAYLAYYWLDRLLVQAEPRGANWPFALAASLLTAALAAYALLGRAGREYFEEYAPAVNAAAEDE